MNNMMSREYLEEVLRAAQGRTLFWVDTSVPVHLRKSITEGDRVYVGNLDFTISD